MLKGVYFSLNELENEGVNLKCLLLTGDLRKTCDAALTDLGEAIKRIKED